MNPITKFEWKDNIEQEKDLLEYISILEELYIPDFDYDTDSPYYYGYERINKSEVSAEEWEEICNQPIYINVSETLRTFGDRYNKGLIAEHFNYANYMKHELIQQFIRGLDLDADKFWMLLLFIYDYSYHYYIEGIDMGESPNEQLLKFTKAIIDNVESFDEKTGSIFTQSTTLKICVEGERNIIIDNPTAIHYIADATLKMMQQDDLNSIGIMSHKRRLGTSTSTKDSPFITFFAKMFLDFFNTQSQVILKRKKGPKYSQKDTDLICQLIAFTKLSTKSCWSQTENDTLKAFLKQYKDFEPSTINSVYPSFRM